MVGAGVEKDLNDEKAMAGGKRSFYISVKSTVACKC